MSPTKAPPTSAVQAACYLRISSDPTGQEQGVARQRKDCVALCNEKGWTPVEYVDNDISASSGKVRPSYERMLADIRDGKVSAVVAWDLDRLHRRPIELEAFMTLADDRKIALATVSGEVDLSTAQGRLVARLKGSVAAHETEHMKARMRAAAKARAEKGVPKWRQAFGYMSTDSGPVPNPTTAPLVRDGYKAILAGGSISDLARVWNAAGHYGLNGTPWTTATLSLFLRKPRNAGLRTHNGEIVGKGAWEAIVDEGTWRSVQGILNTPGRGPGRKTVRRHLLTGMMRCGREGCGGYLCGNWQMQSQPNGPRSHAIAYSCRDCRRVSVRAEHIEPLLHSLVTGRLAQPDAVDLLKKVEHDAAAADALRTEANTLRARLDELAAERALGLMDGQQLKVASDVVRAKLADIERQQQDEERLRVFDGIPLGSSDVVAAVDALTPDRLRAVMSVLMTVTIAPVGKRGNTFDPERVRVEWRQ